ncbi:hypothetical protein D1007_11047 [Hordeum vulgare]|nr:hypothetical protein D1007_11047 [Hordeum vulgare]
MFLTFFASICKMVDAHGDACAVAEDVVELQGLGAVTADVGGVHSSAGQLATVADVAGSTSSLQKVKASSGPVNQDAPVAPLAMEEQYDSGDDVYKENVASFTAKEVHKIKAKGVASFCRKFKKCHCPYCTTKPNPKDGRFDHLMSHVEDVAIRWEDYKIRGQHAALAKALTSA